MLQQPGDRAFAAAHRAVQQEDALLNPITLRSTLQRIDQVFQWLIQAKHRVATLVLWVIEELVMNPLDPAGFLIIARHRRDDHVIYPLKRVARRIRALPHEIQILLERPDPVLLPELVEVLSLGDERDNFATVAHNRILPGYRWRWAKPALLRQLSPAPPYLEPRPSGRRSIVLEWLKKTDYTLLGLIPGCTFAVRPQFSHPASQVVSHSHCAAPSVAVSGSCIHQGTNSHTRKECRRCGGLAVAEARTCKRALRWRPAEGQTAATIHVTC